MSSCSSCGTSLDEGEQFCPDCGAATPLPPLPHLPPEFFVQETAGEPEPEPEVRSRSLLLFAIAALLIVAAGGIYVVLGDRAQPEPQPSAYAVELPEIAEEVAKAAPVPPAPAPSFRAAPRVAAAAPKISRIEPGLWRFESELYDVTSATLGNPINDISAFPLRRVVTAERCITPQIAAAPASAAFPIDPSKDCNVQRFSMSDGAYRAAMRCFAGGGTSRVDVEVGGDFDANSARLTVHTSMMAADLSANVAVDEPIVSHTSLRGTRIGPCRGAADGG